MICFVFIPGKCTTAFPLIRTVLAVGCATRCKKCALSRQTRPDCRGFSGILNVADGKRQNPQLIRGPAGGVRVASRRPCQQRITPVFDRDRMTRMSTANGIRKTRCCIGRSRPIWRPFSLASKNAAARFRNLSSARCGRTCLVGCWPVVFCGSSVNRAERSGSCRCLAKAEACVRPVADAA